MLEGMGVFIFVLTRRLNFDKHAYNDTNAWQNLIMRSLVKIVMVS